MRKLILAFGALALLATSLPAASSSASAQERTVIIKRDGDRGYHRGHRARTVIVKRDRGYHRGWDRGHHRGWDRGRRGNTVIIRRD